MASSLKVAQLLRSAACLHTNQSRSYLKHLVFTVFPEIIHEFKILGTQQRQCTRIDSVHFYQVSNVSPLQTTDRDVDKPQIKKKVYARYELGETPRIIKRTKDIF